MKLAEIAEKIDAHLKRFEADPCINRFKDKARAGLRPYYRAGSWASGGYVMVSYVAYQGMSSMRRVRAEKYLAWLDDGGVGHHHIAEVGDQGGQ